MATNEAMKSALQTSAPQKSLVQMINESAKELGRALPAHLNADRITRIATTACRTNPKLLQCSPESFLGALFTSAQMGLEPVAGMAYLIPFSNSKKKPDGTWHKVLEAQFVVGYKGLIDLFYRHAKAVEIVWGVVHENDEFEFEYGSNAILRHRPKLTDRGTVIAYWVQATLSNGGKPFKVMSHEDCMAHGREHSKTFDKKTNSFYNDSPWHNEPQAMCLKTVLIQLAKILPLSVELQRAISADESSRDFRDVIKDGLDAPSKTEWKDEVPGEESPATVEPLPPGVSVQKKDEDIPFGE